MLKDYYKILGLDRTATSEMIKKAYYKLAKQYHPDKNLNNPKALYKYYQINEAYEVLGNLDKRLEYSIQLFDYYNEDFKFDENELNEIKEAVKNAIKDKKRIYK